MTRSKHPIHKKLGHQLIRGYLNNCGGREKRENAFAGCHGRGLSEQYKKKAPMALNRSVGRD